MTTVGVCEIFVVPARSIASGWRAAHRLRVVARLETPGRLWLWHWLRLVLATAVHFAELAAVTGARAHAFCRLGVRGGTPAMLPAVNLAVLSTVTAAFADAAPIFPDRAILSAVDFAVLAAVALLVVTNAPAIILTRAVRTALDVIARCMAAFVKGELFSVPALLIAWGAAAHLSRECSCWRVVKALLWLRLGLGLLLRFC